jgi:tripartite-type tricarboxylate transporter receptor subunit TctC
VTTLLPEVPTVSEAGYPEINVVPWFGYGVPRGIQQPVVDKIVASFNEVMKVPKVRAALEQQALQPMEPMNARQIADLYAADTEKYAKVIRGEHQTFGLILDRSSAYAKHQI